MILGIDTSTTVCSIALYAPEEGVAGEQTWRSGREQTTQLLPEIERLMHLVGTNVDRLEGVAVATGPGSFSGVRIGLSAAKSLAYALDLNCWGIPTLDALAFAHASVTAAQVCAVLELGRGRLAWAIYRTRGTQWQRLSGYESGTPDEMAAFAAEGDPKLVTLFCGELDAPAHELLLSRLGSGAAIAPPASALRRAAYLVELALQRRSRGESDDPATLQALYLQPGSR